MNAGREKGKGEKDTKWKGRNKQNKEREERKRIVRFEDEIVEWGADDARGKWECREFRGDSPLN